jgi:protein-tyrosine-phosphatase
MGLVPPEGRSVPSVLFVCTANICRSPVAEALFADWLERNNIPGEWQVSSAGTWAVEGEPASRLSLDVLQASGLDHSRHRARRVSGAMLENAHLVLCMTRAQQEGLRLEFPAAAGRVHLISEMPGGRGYDIADPFGGTREAYQEMADELRRLVEQGGPTIVRLASQQAGSNS